MALQENIKTFSFDAGAAIEQYRLVRTTGARAVSKVSAATAQIPVGVCINKASAAGQAVTVANGGIVKVEAGGSITAGAILTSNASGQAAAAATGNIAWGIAVTGATGAGQVIEAMWLGPWIAA